MTKEQMKRKYESPSVEVIGGETNDTDNLGGNRYSLPYGLCKNEGINTDGMRPREAWEALKSKTGKSKEQIEKEHWGKSAKDSKEGADSNSLQDTRQTENKTENEVKTSNKGILKNKLPFGLEDEVVEHPTIKARRIKDKTLICADWFANKAFTEFYKKYGHKYEGFDNRIFAIIGETEKAYNVILGTAFNHIATWCPKSLMSVDKEPFTTDTTFICDFNNAMELAKDIRRDYA